MLRKIIALFRPTPRRESLDTVERALRDIANQSIHVERVVDVASAEPARVVKNKGGRPKGAAKGSTKARNDAMRRAVAKGESIASVARKFGLSYGMAHRIVKAGA